MFVVAFIQFASDLTIYGWSYQVTTIIFDEEVTKTVYVAYELVACFFFVWFLALSVQNYRLIGEKSNRENDRVIDKVG